MLPWLVVTDARKRANHNTNEIQATDQIKHDFAPCEVMQESLGFRIPRCGFRIPCLWIPDFSSMDFGFPKWLDSRFQNSILDSGVHLLDSGFQTKITWIPHSGLSYMGRTINRLLVLQCFHFRLIECMKKWPAWLHERKYLAKGSLGKVANVIKVSKLISSWFWVKLALLLLLISKTRC